MLIEAQQARLDMEQKALPRYPRFDRQWSTVLLQIPHKRENRRYAGFSLDVKGLIEVW